MIERLDNHIPGGGSVLYIDGHVEFVRYPGEWPVTEESIGILESFDAPQPLAGCLSVCTLSRRVRAR